MRVRSLVSPWCFDYSVEQQDAVAWLVIAGMNCFFFFLRLAASLDRLWINAGCVRNNRLIFRSAMEKLPFKKKKKKNTR